MPKRHVKGSSRGGQFAPDRSGKHAIPTAAHKEQAPVVDEARSRKPSRWMRFKRKAGLTTSSTAPVNSRVMNYRYADLQFTFECYSRPQVFPEHPGNIVSKGVEHRWVASLGNHAHSEGGGVLVTAETRTKLEEKVRDWQDDMYFGA